MCLTPCSVATEFSILRATSVSICDGAAPGSVAVTVTVGRSMSGNCWIFIARKAIRPTSVSMTNSRIAGIGLRIDQEETFTAVVLQRSAPPAVPSATTRTVSPSARKPAPWRHHARCPVRGRR